MSEISGNTAVYGLVGDPIAHTLSPMIQNYIARARGDDMAYVAFPVRAGTLGTALQGAKALGIQGLNVTMPHKSAVMSFLTGLDESSRLTGVANTLKLTADGYYGYTTDIIGVTKALAMRNVPVRGKSAVIVGAGGTAAAAALAMAQGGAERIVIANRTVEYARVIARHLSQLGAAAEAMPLADLSRLAGCDILINSTTVGFADQKGQSPIADPALFERVGVFFDVIYAPWETKALKDAASRGTPCFNGFDMLFYQAAASYEIWHNATLDTALLTDVRAQCEEAYRQKH